MATASDDLLPLVGTLDDGTPYISPSQSRMVLRCGAQWRFKYRDGLPDEIGVDAVIGFAVDDALGQACQALIDGDEAPNPEEVGTQARSVVPEKVEGDAIHWPDPEDPTLEELQDEAERMAVAGWEWFRDQDLEPVAVQGQTVKRIDDWAIYGYYDLLARTSDGYLTVLDWKTVKRSPSKNDSGDHLASRYYQMQVLGYVAGLAEEGEQVAEAGVVHLVRNKTPKVVHAPVPVTQQSLAWAETLYRNAVHLIRHDVTPPNPFGAGWLCHPDRCSYWDHCPGAAEQEKLGG